MPDGKPGVVQIAWSSVKSSGETFVVYDKTSPVSGSTNLIYILFFFLSGFPSISFLGVNPKPVKVNLVPPMLGPLIG